MQTTFNKIKTLSLLFFIVTFCVIAVMLNHITDKDGSLEQVILIMLLVAVPTIFFTITIQFQKIIKSIIKQKIKIERILNSQKNILIVTDGENIIEANRAFLDFFSFGTLNEFKAKYRCICDHFVEEYGFLQSKMENHTWVEYVLNHPDSTHLAKIIQNGEEHILKVFAKRVESNNQAYEVVVTFEDITKELAIEKELKIQKNSITEANDTKNQFLANISHELRTPMNAIMGFTKLLFDTKLDLTQYNLLVKINDSSRLLLNIIEDILSITQIESKEFKIENKPLYLDEFTEYIETAFEEEALNQNNKFIVNIDEKLPKIIIIDKIKLLQVVTNFLTNAFKFTKDGEITFSVTLIKQINQESATIKFSVTDTGIGIKDDFKELIFNQFFQADNSDTRQYKGTGLGLPICQKIVELFGSKIELESTLGVGSKFSFTVTVDILDDDLINMHNSYPVFEDLRILLVEDNVINQEVATMILTKSDIRVDIATNGLEAIEIFKANPNSYDMILMDIQMPVLNGFEATEEIRKIDTNVPIIALTASNLIEDKKKAQDVNMNDFLLKPINTDALYKTIIKYIVKLKNQKIKYVKNNLNIENNILNKSALASSFNDQEFVDKLLRKFLEQLNNEFKDIVEEVKNHTKKAKSLIHGLKGTSGNLSAISLFEICKKIDEKYKKSIYVTPDDIKTLEEELENVRKELDYLNEDAVEEKSEEIVSVSIDDKTFNNLLTNIITDLESGNFINNDKLQTLYSGIKDRSQKDVNILKNYIEDFEYNLAIEFLKDLKH